ISEIGDKQRFNNQLRRVAASGTLTERSATCLRFAEREHVRVARRQDPREAYRTSRMAPGSMRVMESWVSRMIRPCERTTSINTRYMSGRPGPTGKTTRSYATSPNTLTLSEAETVAFMDVRSN